MPFDSISQFKPIPQGTRFSKLVVLGEAKPGRDRRGHQFGISICQCDCGVIKTVRNSHLKSGVQSCGCYNPNNIHGHTNSRGESSMTYARWRAMKARCNNPKHSHFRYYGGRGIKVCERWEDFRCFLSDMGECPGPKWTLDRINGDLGYAPSNCRWATRKTQGENRKTSRMVTMDGECHCITVWAEKYGIRRETVYGRIRWGWPFELAIKTPASPKRSGDSGSRVGHDAVPGIQNVV